MKAAPWILLGIGLVITMVFGLLALISMLLVATSGGRVDPEEAGPFIGMGCCCTVPGIGMAIGGLVWWLIARQQGSPPGPTPGSPMPPLR